MYNCHLLSDEITRPLVHVAVSELVERSCEYWESHVGDVKMVALKLEAS